MHRALVQRIASEAFAGHKKLAGVHTTCLNQEFILLVPIDREENSRYWVSMVEANVGHDTYFGGSSFLLLSIATKRVLHATIPLNIFLSHHF